VLHVGGKDGWVAGNQAPITLFLFFKLLPKVVIGYLNLRKDLQLITTKK